jgi:predicted dinucleotide-binding enzyme
MSFNKASLLFSLVFLYLSVDVMSLTNKVVAVIGSGDVGQTIANGFLKHGFQVILASREPTKLNGWLQTAEPKGKASTATFSEASAKAEIIVLAVNGRAGLDAVDQCGINNLKGKIVIDSMNPLDGTFEEGGILGFYAGVKDSLMEALQAKAPDAKFVKALNSCGYSMMINPDFGEVKPTMFICGNDADAKAQVSQIMDLFGWETCDMGGVKTARAIEPLCQLWCIRAYGKGKGYHAFKLLTKDEL